MVFLVILAFLQVQPARSPDTDFITYSKSQADLYIRHIRNNQHADYNLWALYRLGSDNKRLQSYIEQTITDKYSSNRLLSEFSRFGSEHDNLLKRLVFTSGSSDLLVALLLQTEAPARKKNIYQQFQRQFNHPDSSPVNYGALCRAIIHGKSISSAILPNRQFLLPHFFLLFDDDRSQLLSADYITSITKKWTKKATPAGTLPEIIAQTTLFRAYYLTDQYQKTNALYDLLAKNQLFPNSSLKLRIYRYLDYSMYRLGYYDRNLNIARKFTLPLAKYLGQESLVQYITFTMGINLYSIGKVNEAKERYQQVLRENINNSSVNQSSLYNNLGITYIKLGQYDKYLELQLRALEKATNNRNYSHQIKIFNNLYVFYKKTSDYKSALSYLKKSRTLSKVKGDSTNLGRNYISFGSFFKEFKNNLSKALFYFSKAGKFLKPNKDFRYYTYLLDEQAQTYEMQGKYDTALKKYNRLLELTKEQNSSAFLDALVSKAYVYITIGNVKKAKVLIDRFKSYDLTILDFAQVVKAKTVEAAYLNKTGHADQALDILYPSLDLVVKRAKKSADLESGFWHVEDQYLDAFELTVNILLDQHKAGRAVEVLDRFKTINDASLYQNPLVRSQQLNEKELTQYKRLTDQLDATRKKLLLASGAERFDLQQGISLLSAKKQKLDKKLNHHTGRRDVSVSRIQRHLSAHEMVLHATELNNHYYLATISRSKVSMKVIPFNEAKRNLLSGAVDDMAHNKTNMDSLYAITKMLGLNHIPESIHKITVIPDSYLYQLPIDVLPLEKPAQKYSYGEAHYLVEDFSTDYLTSLNDFDWNTTDRSSDDKWDFVGYGVSNYNKPLVPLPYAPKEVRKISKDLTNFPRKKLLINKSATKKAFKQTASKAKVLHFAAHSNVSDRDPLFSTIYLGNTTSDADSSYKDRIYAYELFELNLNNEMIMLNSCESGSGSYLPGTGIMGFSRALRYAGARSLILNLWSVNDMLASDFATYFYKELNKGQTKPEALRNTKIHFLQTQNASPHFWAPYMLIGNSRPLVRPYQNTNNIVAAAFVGYFLLIVGLSLMKEKGILFEPTDPEEQSKDAA